ncbi:MAG: hypothetical protein ACM3JJ_10375 [Hyphomicrobiales bacterium]
MKRAAALILSATLALASALPILGTRMVCGPGMDAKSMADASYRGTASCEATPTCAEMEGRFGLRAGTCCRIAPVDEAGAITATLSDHRPSSDDGRGLFLTTLPANASLHGAALASAPPIGGSPPTPAPPSPTRTTVLRN